MTTSPEQSSLPSVWERLQDISNNFINQPDLFFDLVIQLRKNESAPPQPGIRFFLLLKEMGYTPENFVFPHKKGYSSKTHILDRLWILAEEEHYTKTKLESEFGEFQWNNWETLSLFLFLYKNKIALAWVSRHYQSTSPIVFDKVPFSSRTIEQIASVPGFETFSAQVSFEEVCYLNYQLGLDDTTLQLLVTEPRLVTVLLQFISEKNARTSTDDCWDLTLRYFDTIATLLGRKPALTNDLYQFLLQSWYPETDQEKELQARFSTLSAAEQVLIMKRLKNEIVSEGRFTEALNYFHTTPESKVNPIWTPELERLVHLWESGLHPLTRLLPTTGYEIEHNRSQDFDHYDLFENIGVHPGTDQPYETAPGPFQWYGTAIILFRMWVGTNLLDLSSHTQKTLHYNLGVRDTELSCKAVSLLRATGYTFIPETSEDEINDDYDEYYHQIFDQNVRVETKGYEVLNPNDFELFYYLASVFGSGQKAVEKLFTQTEITSASGLPKQKQIRNSHLSLYEKQLAAIWTETLATWLSVLESHHINVSNLTTTRIKMRRYQTLIQAVFPDRDSYENPNQSHIETGHPIRHNHQVYPNLVAFARSLLITATNQMESVFDGYMRDFSTALQKLNQSQPRNPQKLLQFAATFGGTYPHLSEAIEHRDLAFLNQWIDSLQEAFSS